MDATRVIESIRFELNRVQSSGQQTVPVPALLQFLAALEQSAPASPEAMKCQHEWELTICREQNAVNLKMFQAVIDAGKTALSTSILVNGGATVALLAFIGNLLSKDMPVGPKSPLLVSLILFSLGVWAGAVSTGVNYLAQRYYYQGPKPLGDRLNVVSISFVIAAYALFAGGVAAAYLAFNSFLVAASH